MFKVDKTRISLIRGDSLILNIEIKVGDYDYDIQNTDIIMFVLRDGELFKDKTDYVVKKPVIVKMIPNDKLILQLDPEDTAQLSFGRYVYDIKLITEEDEVDTFISDTFDILPDGTSIMTNGVFIPSTNIISGKLSIFEEEEES